MTPGRRKRVAAMLGRMFDRLLSYEQEARDDADDAAHDLLQTARIVVGESAYSLEHLPGTTPTSV